MRVIAGSARGKHLGELEGMETRPTTDRVKEGIFNALQFRIPDARVLDLFAGTGQLGIECLSRGASHAVFLDQRKEAHDLIVKNLSMTRLSDRGRVIQGNAISWLSSCREEFDLIFLDPPYETNLLEISLERIAEIDILSKNGIIICESRSSKEFSAINPRLVQGRVYRYGKIKVTTFLRSDI